MTGVLHPVVAGVPAHPYPSARLAATPEQGLNTDAESGVAVVCRFTESGRLLIITVYRIPPLQG